MKLMKRNENPLSLFEDVFGTLFNDSFGTMTKGVNSGVWSPAVDIVEKDGHFTLIADLPGVGKEDIKLTIDEGSLTLSGERKSEKSEATEYGHRYERAYGKFSRSFTLGSGIDVKKVSADFKNGTLTVELPKLESSKPFEVSIAE